MNISENQNVFNTKDLVKWEDLLPLSGSTGGLVAQLTHLIGRSLKVVEKKVYSLSEPIQKIRGNRGKKLGACLMYHRVTKDQNFKFPFFLNGVSISVEMFEKHIQMLSENFNCLSLDELVSCLQNKNLPSDTVAVTFDDGFSDSFELALPILEKYRVPATIFVSSNFINDTIRPWWVEQHEILSSVNAVELMVNKQNQKSITFNTSSQISKYLTQSVLDLICKRVPPYQASLLMNELRKNPKASSGFKINPIMLTSEQLKELANSQFITIGGHTVNHPPLAALTTEESSYEIKTGKEVLEKILNKPIQHFAYPFGGHAHYQNKDVQLSREAGFVSSWTTCRHCFYQQDLDSLDLHQLPRLAVYGTDSPLELKRMIR